jgi:hypothetical protein
MLDSANSLTDLVGSSETPKSTKLFCFLRGLATFVILYSGSLFFKVSGANISFL